jgi:hypothetical protein
MNNKPPRTTHRARSWAEIASLLIPLVVVGIAGMAISYATLIDVATTNGLPLPELFPILIDVGTIACMVAAAQFRRNGIPGRWLAYLMFIALSMISVFANASHAVQHANPKLTAVWVACVLAATPPAALLGITHLVMALVPDTRERRRLAAARDTTPPPAVTPSVELAAAPTREPSEIPRRRPSTKPTDRSDDAVVEWALDHYRATGRKPTGAEVGARLGLSAKSGQRFLQAVPFDAVTVTA